MEILERKDVKIEDTWDLSHVYKNEKAWEQDLEKMQQLAEELAGLQGKLSQDFATLNRAMELSEELEIIASSAMCYAERLYDEDTSHAEHQAMRGKMMSVYAKIGEKCAFLDPELTELSEEDLQQWFQEHGEFRKKYFGYIQEVRRKKAHTLSAECEQIMAMTSEMRQTAENTYDILMCSELRFDPVKNAQGEELPLTHGNYIRMLESADRTLRKNAFQNYYKAYGNLIGTFASLYDGQLRQQIFGAKARKYASTLDASLDASRVDTKVYHTLIDTVNQNLHYLHDYVSLRKKELAVEELHMYDIYTPIVSGVAKKYTYEEAKEIALKALAPLGADYLAIVQEAFDNRWIDVYENKGKQTGAYSTCAYGKHPYMLLNYTGALDDIFTLVHEMGHSIHSWYSDHAQPFYDSQYRIFVAEVASTTNEVLLLEYLLQHSTDEAEQKYLRNHYLDMFKGTVFRQTQFAEFELETNRLAEAGETLTAERLSKLYGAINEKYYGKDTISDAEISWEWARIPHFYYDFYVYQYATSMCASVAIGKAILTEGTPAVERYKKFLQSGCSDTPVELLKIAGVDLSTAKPIEDALAVMGEVLEQMK